MHSYHPAAAEKWQTIARGTYFTSCLTQCVFVSPGVILTAGTDGHAALWPLKHSFTLDSKDVTSAELLEWEQPRRIHQNASKTFATHKIYDRTTLVVSGGDDGSLSFLLASGNGEPKSALENSHSSIASLHPPLIVARAHASAVTACTIFMLRSRLFVVTSGNDQWVRVWEILPRLPDNINQTEESQNNGHFDPLEIARLKKMKTNVADVSSMAILGVDRTDASARVLICGVGMEVIRIE